MNESDVNIERPAHRLKERILDSKTNDQPKVHAVNRLAQLKNSWNVFCCCFFFFFFWAVLNRKFLISKFHTHKKNWYQYVTFAKCEIYVWSISINFGV